MSHLQRECLKNQGFQPLTNKPPLFDKLKLRSGEVTKPSIDFSPLPWTDYWREKKSIDLEGKRGRINVYSKGDSGPAFLLLHGGGYSGLTWSCFAHELSSRLDCRIYAPDLRGHGLSETSDDSDLSMETLCCDVAQLVSGLFPANDDAPNPPLIVAGHSMGGAVAVHAAAKGCFPTLIALAVIDVVEGSALSALRDMHSVLASRPSSFSSPTHAVQWCVKSGLSKNVEAARVSMPAQIVVAEPGFVSSPLSQSADDCSLPPASTSFTAETIAEEAETDESSDENYQNADSLGQISTSQRETPDRSNSSDRIADSQAGNSAIDSNDHPALGPGRVYKWRIDLESTAQYWRGWFEGLSAEFLSVSAPKLLLLAGVDRLDKELMVGQMQGKFQMVVLPRVGHAIQEDDPAHLADAIAAFCIRHRFTTAKMDFEPVYPGC